MDQNVDPEIISSILSAMAAAPTGGNSSSVEYTVIDDKERVHEIWKLAYSKMDSDARRHVYIHSFWGDTLAQPLAAEMDFVLNLASKEYSKAVEPHLPTSVHFLTCTFGEWKDGKVIEKGTMCKMVRGQMVRWLAENNVTNWADIRAFDQLGYRLQPELSNKNHNVFLKSGT